MNTEALGWICGLLETLFKGIFQILCKVSYINSTKTNFESYKSKNLGYGEVLAMEVNGGKMESIATTYKQYTLTIFV